MLAVMYLLTRGLFRVGFEWRRLAQLAAILAGVAVSGELLLPTDGFGGLALRAAWLALVPAALLLTRFFHPHEREQARAARDRRPAHVPPSAPGTATSRPTPRTPCATSRPNRSRQLGAPPVREHPSASGGRLVVRAAASRRPSPRPGLSVAVTWRQ